MRTSMPCSSRKRAMPSTFSSRGLENTCRMSGLGLRACVLRGLGLDDTNQAFLRRACDELAVAVEHLPARQAATVLRARAVDRIQQPFVCAERAVEPQRV